MIVNGKKLADQILKELKEIIKKRRLKLAAILVGDSLTGSGRGLKKFVELKKKAAENIGIDFDLYEFPENVSEKKIVTAVRNISEAKNINGILIELPLPTRLDRQKILDAIPVEKDVDVLSSSAQGKFYSGDFIVLPPAVEAIKIILENPPTGKKLNLKNKKVAVFGQGLLVGKPVAYWFSKMRASVTVIDEFTKNPGKYSKKADIIVSGVGKPNLIKGDMVKKGVIIFDFGYSPSHHNRQISEDKIVRRSSVWRGGKNLEGKIAGDIDFKQVSKKAKLITPVPGGVGPLVVAAVLKNLVELSKK